MAPNCFEDQRLIYQLQARVNRLFCALHQRCRLIDFKGETVDRRLNAKIRTLGVSLGVKDIKVVS